MNERMTKRELALRQELINHAGLDHLADLEFQFPKWLEEHLYSGHVRTSSGNDCVLKIDMFTKVDGKWRTIQHATSEDLKFIITRLEYETSMVKSLLKEKNLKASRPAILLKAEEDEGLYVDGLLVEKASTREGEGITGGLSMEDWVDECAALYGFKKENFAIREYSEGYYMGLPNSLDEDDKRRL